nr:LapA family protein [uncultured Thioclava sp.]
MRALRLLFLGLLAILLIALALANRDIVTLRLLPNEAGSFLGYSWSLQMPLFLVVFAGVILGLLIGFVWEWIREAKLRRTASRATRKADKLEAEVKTLRHKSDGPKDDVLALLDSPAR